MGEKKKEKKDKEKKEKKKKEEKATVRSAPDGSDNYVECWSLISDQTWNITFLQLPVRPAASTAEAKRQRVRTEEVKVMMVEAMMVEVDNLQERGVGILKQVRKPWTKSLFWGRHLKSNSYCEGREPTNRCQLDLDSNILTRSPLIGWAKNFVDWPMLGGSQESFSWEHHLIKA